MATIPSEIIEAAQASQDVWHVPSSVTIAQWAIESGWGKHSPGNNPFGMKPRKGKNDPCQTLMTTEFVKGKACKVAQPFRKFASIGEAFKAHAELIATAPVYAQAMKCLPDVDKFINALALHYATDPKYAALIRGIIQKEGLREYDTEA